MTSRHLKSVLIQVRLSVIVRLAGVGMYVCNWVNVILSNHKFTYTLCVSILVDSRNIQPPTIHEKTKITLEEDERLLEDRPVSSPKLQHLAFQEFSPPQPPVRIESQFRHRQQHSASSPPPRGASLSSPSSSFTHLSITRATLDPLLRSPSPPPQVPPHLTDLQVSPTASTETFRADFETQEGSTILSNTGDNDPVISGEFVLIRQTIDDSNTPRVKQDTQMMVPVPLHATASLGEGPLIGPGFCRVTTESRQQAMLDGHFRLRRSGANPSRHEKRALAGSEGESTNEPLAPEPPQRTTSLRSSTSTLASIGEATLKPQQSAQSPTTSSEELSLYVANPLVDNPVVDPFTGPYMVSQSYNFTSTNNNLPLTPIPEMSEFSLQSSLAASSNGSLPRPTTKRIHDISPTRPIPSRPSSWLRSSLENNPLDLLAETNQTKGMATPSSLGSSSLNEFLRLEEQESASDELEKQLMEGQEGDRSLVESVIGGMRNVEEEGETTSLSRSLGPSIHFGGTDSLSMLSSSNEMGLSIATGMGTST
ncbi:hypothetical protein Aperf_G00000048257 [Anoplocephala perfoliata]